MDVEKLKDKILEKGMTNDDLAFRLGISVKTLNAKLKNRSHITIQEADNLVKILKIANPSDIFFTPQSQICNSLNGGETTKNRREMFEHCKESTES